ncbi:MAG: SMI1/KNR4 family protein [Verrucomicrobia bacterium]|nr:SMI1/KNR4 family protein [Verrucomicrobiota bacterium]
MTEIESILKSGVSSKDESLEKPTVADIKVASIGLGFSFPKAYLEFVQLGGLSELRFNHAVLSPGEIWESSVFLPDKEHIPFAENGCGDMYCWRKNDSDNPDVLFWDHETGDYSKDSDNFSVWLRKNRF